MELKHTFFTPFARRSMGVFMGGGAKSVLWPKVGLRGPLVRPAGQLGWLAGQVPWLH
jgi:hypothetical protein